MNQLGNNCSKYGAALIGTGSSLPEKILTNDDLSKIVETNDEWITTRTGIKIRHISSDTETTSVLATRAAVNALEAAKITPDELDLIIVATITPEMVFPSTACFVQNELKAFNAAAFDVTAACSGFVYGMSIAEQFVKSGKNKNVLVIGAETLSKITNYEDRGSCILFGDGAGAAIIQRTEDTSRGIIYSNIASDGSGWETLSCQAHGSRYPASKPLDDPSKIYMCINGRETYQLAVRRIVEMVNCCLEENGLTIEDIKMFVPHQMNARIIESSSKRLKLKPEQVFINIEKTGNTSSASIPVALDECIKAGKLSQGDYVILVAFGAGLTWGANLIRI